MIIYIGADHAGFPLKESLKPFLTDIGYEVEDMGAFELDQDDDYPNFIAPVARSVVNNRGSLGIVLGGSGQGEAMQANRFDGIRAAVYYGGDTEVVRLSREHNNSNVLSLGARFLDEEEAMEVVKLWLGTPFSGDERHTRRLKKVDEND